MFDLGVNIFISYVLNIFISYVLNIFLCYYFLIMYAQVWAWWTMKFGGSGINWIAHLIKSNWIGVVWSNDVTGEILFQMFGNFIYLLKLEMIQSDRIHSGLF